MQLSIHSPQRKRGGAIIAVLVFSVAISLVFAATVSYSITESRLNRQAEAFLVAKHAAEAAVEFGFGELASRFDSSRAFPTDALSPDNDPLTLPADFTNIFSRGQSGNGSDLKLEIMTNPNAESSWGPTEVMIPELGFDPEQPWGTYDLELVGGVIESSGMKFIDSNTPGNEFDPLAGSFVLTRQVRIYAKATVKSALDREFTAYTSQELQVRDSPLFSYAIFFNGMNLEIFPWPPMDIYGPVHSNSNMYLVGTQGLNFHEKLTTSEHIYHGRDPLSNHYHGDARTIYIKNGSDTLVQMDNGTNSTMSNWRRVASQKWDGRVLTSDHGVSEQQPLGMQAYVKDTDTSTPEWEPLNYSYNIIQPVLNENTFDSGDADVDAQRRAMEEDKFSYKAGITLEYDGTNVNAYTYERDANEDITYAVDGSPKKIDLTVSTPFWTLNTSGSLTDHREGLAPDLIEIDMAQLGSLLDDNDATDWGASVDTAAADEKPENWWNGVVYIQTPLDASAPARDDWVTPADENTAVRLNNGGTLPNPSYAVSNGIYGTTVATNTYLYINGSYNSDGDLSTGSPKEPDDDVNYGSTGEEVPAAIIADAVTILSDSWDDANSSLPLGNRRAVDTEVSAALLTGQVPTGFWGNPHSSGGIQNFPRFIEDWGGGTGGERLYYRIRGSPLQTDLQTLRYRGSLVGLFSSEVAKEPWGKANVFTPPRRDWGFHTKFGDEGFFPPGTPNTRTYRRINFRDLSQEEYETEVKALAAIWGISTLY